MRRIILASQSEARKELFLSLGIPFDVVPAGIDEKKIRDKNLQKRAQNIANAKATKILEQNPDSIIIACDTFSECERVTLEKPKNPLEAKRMLKLLSGKKAVNYTAFRYIDRAKKIDFSKTVKVFYTFRTLYEKEIDIYVEKFQVTQWAAGFALVFPYITTFISSVNGSYTGLSYGLPTELLIPLLRKSGFEPNPIR
jgi:septum formation protein